MSYAPISSEPTLDYSKKGRSIHPQEHFSKSNSQNQNRLLKSKRARGSRAKSLAPESRHGLSWPIIVHCHLAWDWVWQRPQQFVSRLSQNHKILFVETLPPDPALASPSARFRTPEKFPNITILSLQFPAGRWSDGDYVDAERRRLVQEFLAGPAAGQFTDAVQWFYDPMAAPAFVDQLGESLTVYDCMDELSKFRCAPPNIAQREAQLLAKADLVFTGGRKLFESKSRQNRNCHFYGCGVDCEHFGLARYAHTPTPPAMAVLQKPILGYFGVVDERLDYELISQLADANPNWSVAIIGPTLKVENDPLPQRPNLHWLGRQPYEDLPGFCKAFDVCIMPFALNESTEFINPTKALEYMATARPIVSTPVADVVRNFGEVITIGHTADEFINHCREALEQSKPAALQRGLQMAQENSWDSIVAHLEEHVSDALKKKTAVSNL